MREAGKWLIRIAVTGILFLLFSGSAFAMTERRMEAGCPSLCGAKVIARWKNELRILSLPGVWDMSAVTLEMEGEETLLLGEEQIPVTPGEPTDLTGLIGQRLIVRNGAGAGRGYLMILQGSEIPALFLEVDGKMLSKVNQSKNYEISEGRAVYEEADGSAGATTRFCIPRNRTSSSWRRKPP